MTTEEKTYGHSGTKPNFADEGPRDEFDPEGPGPGKTKEELEILYKRDKALTFLKSVQTLILRHPQLAACHPTISTDDAEVSYWSWWCQSDKLIAEIPEFGWTEVQEKLDPPIIDAVAKVDGVTIRVRQIRVLEQQPEPFVPRDLNPANKEFTEVV